MSTTMIANISLLVSALLALFAMLRFDLQNLHHNGYSNKRYNAWLRESGDISSIKRLLAAAVLIGSFTTMAMTSWMVVMFLAAALLALAISMLIRRPDKPSGLNSRAVSVLITAMVLALLAIGCTYYLGQRTGQADATRPASMLAVILVVISPLLTMLSNWIFHPFNKSPENSQEEGNNDTKE